MGNCYNRSQNWQAEIGIETSHIAENRDSFMIEKSINNIVYYMLRASEHMENILKKFTWPKKNK